MTDLKPCPSCGEPLDHPSGDGCANMTAHKERAMGMAAMSDAPEQIWLGRDERYQGEPWSRLTSDFDEECETQEYIRADRIEQLVATNEALSAKLATCEKYRDAYAECDRIGTQAVRDLEDKLAKAVEGLDAVVQHEASTFFGPDGEKNKRASWRGVMRKVRATLAEIKLQSSELATQKGESHE